MSDYGIGLIGCGTVGSGVAKLLLEHPERLAARAGRRLVLKRVAVKEVAKTRPTEIDPQLLTTDSSALLKDPSIQAVVEVVGGTTWARQFILDALAAGKDVVTANKALLATHGEELFNAGRRHGRTIAFEASVAGGIPIIGAMCQGLAANQITSVQGILNGTSNFILTGMSENGASYQDVLAEAQRRGYAEADPTLDVDGTDAAQKLAILAQIAFGVTVPLEKITRRGIDAILQEDIRYAHELGYTIKLLAEARLEPPSASLGVSAANPKGAAGQLSLHVSPVMLKHLSPLALVRDAYNAIFVVGDAVGSSLFYGRGAGQMPTASAIVADLIDLAAGRAQRTFETLKLWSGASNGIEMRPTSDVSSRFYLRLKVADRPGVSALIAQILAKHEISIASVIQREASDDDRAGEVALIIMTHTAQTGAFTSTLKELDALRPVVTPSVYYPVAY